MVSELPFLGGMTETLRNARYPIDGRAQRILAAAFTEFSRRGVRTARMSLIARRAGVSLTTLRQYFPTTDELFREVIRSTIVRLILRPQESGKPSPDQSTSGQIRGFMRQFWRAMEEPEQAALLRLSLSELNGYPELAVFHATEVMGRAVGRLEGVLGEGARRGEIHLSGHPHDGARDPGGADHVLNLVRLARHLRRAHRAGPPPGAGGGHRPPPRGRGPSSGLTLKRHHTGATRYLMQERETMTADYNGWADQREEEREALDQLELTLATAASTRRRLPALRGRLLRAAAREILARHA